MLEGTKESEELMLRTKSLNQPKRIVVSIRNDDPSALSDVIHEKRIAKMFLDYGLPQTIGVVPNHTRGDPHDRDVGNTAALSENTEMIEFLSDFVSKTDSEIALHGYRHQTNRLSAPSRREYFEFRGLSAVEQEELIQKGSDIIENCLGVRPRTFIPPWNRMDQNTVIALQRQDFLAFSAGPYQRAGYGLVSFGTNCHPGNFKEVFRRAKESVRVVFINLYYHSVTTTSEDDIRALDRALRTIATDAECEVRTIGAAAKAYPAELKMVNWAAKNIVDYSQVLDSPRARSAVYEKIQKKLTGRSRTMAIRSQCVNQYRSGRYLACVQASIRLEKQAKKLRIVARSLTACIGLALPLAVAKWSGMPFGGVYLSLPISLIAGVAMRMRVTALKSKQEMNILLAILVAVSILSVLYISLLG